MRERERERERDGERPRHRRCHLKTEAETGGIPPQAWGRLEPPEAGKRRENPILEPLEGLQSYNTLISDV